MEYEKAYNMIYPLSLKQKWDILSRDLYSEEPQSIYLFMIYLISKDENEAEWQYYCYLYLVYCHPFFDDSMRLAAWHLKQAIKLNPQETKYKKQVISIFYSYPEQFFTHEEYYKYALTVIADKHDDSDAQKILDTQQH